MPQQDLHRSTRPVGPAPRPGLRPAPPPADVYACRLPAVVASLAPIREALDGALAAAGVPLPRREDIVLAVNEATTNAVLHAYRGAPEAGPLEVSASWSGGALVVAVRDRGLGMAPRLDSPGSRLGLALMSRLADVLQIEAVRPGGGTCVTLTFAVAG